MRIRGLTASCLAWLVLASAPIARAEPVLCGTGGRITADEVSITLDGRVGTWLAFPLSREVLIAYRAEAGYLDRISVMARRLDLAGTEANELRLALGAMTRARDEIRAVVRSAEARRVAAERDRDAWWRAPALWLGVGAGLGAALVVLLAYAIGGAT